MIVDIRDSKKYEKSHIPKSLNIPFKMIFKKPFLRGEKIILVNEGWYDKELEESLAGLTDLNIKALILRGGINSWYRSHRPVTGLSFSKDSLSKISVKKFYAIDKKNTGIITIDKNLSNSFKSGFIFYLSNNDIQNSSQIISLIKKQKKGIKTIFLLSEKPLEKIEQNLVKSGLTPVFKVDGTINEYLSWAKKMDSIAFKDNREQKQGPGCMPCLKNKN